MDKSDNNTPKSPTQKSDTQKNENPHRGHRQRMDARVKKDPDFENFAYHEILEYLLFNGIAMGDTNEIAHRLIDKFGSFRNVFYASVEELKAVKGMTSRAAHTVACVIPISRWVFNENKNKKNVKITTTEDAADYFTPFFYNHNIEKVYMVCLDTANCVTETITLSTGSSNEAPFDVREIVSKANSNNASKVVIAHNHPTGSLTPSVADIGCTSRATAGLGAIDVTLMDHLIFVPNGEFYSFHKSGILYRIVDGSDSILGGNKLKEELSFFTDDQKYNIAVKRVGGKFIEDIYKIAQAELEQNINPRRFNSFEE